MAIDAAVLVRAGGSALLALAGIAALILSRERLAAWALGGFLAFQGLLWVGNNLFPAGSDGAPLWLPFNTLLFTGLVAARVLVIFGWPMRLRAHERRALLFASLAAIPFAFLHVVRLWTLPDGWASVRAESIDPQAHEFWIRFPFLVGAVGEWAATCFVILLPLRFAATLPEEGRLRSQLAFGGVFLALNPFTYGGWLLAPEVGIERLVATGNLGASILLVAVPAWLLATRKHDGRLAAHVAHGLLALLLAGMMLHAFWPVEADNTVVNVAVGVQRSAYAFLFAYAIARLGVLGYDLQVRTARRGTLAMGALAALFIVAQVAQQFLSAQYGLLMGGVVAGALLFVANPVQRAMERITDRPAPAPLPSPSPSADDITRREGIYLNAARLAMRDRRLTRAEEAHLHTLAEELGLGAKRAHELLVQAESEAGVDE